MKRIGFCFSSLLFVFLAFTFSFCSSKNEEMLLPQANIQITTPIENSIIKFGETLSIKGTATRNE
jgi:hypothetical protein